MKGKFITFEGCEGSGKSTHVTLFREYLDKNGIDYVFLREPGGTEISEKIRKIILDIENKEMTDQAEALLYAAARAQLIGEKILPAINSGKLVVVDRYVDSSFAYQAYARGLGIDFVKKINSFAIENCMPDCTVFLDISPRVAFERKGGADKDDRLELSGIEFHERVYNGYLKLIESEPNRFVVIDPTGTKQETHEKIVNALKKVL
ncbi:MAG: dTMP kinase [Clostridia bacterium]|nr:dTMP kinase [Clostridia bacterium]